MRPRESQKAETNFTEKLLSVIHDQKALGFFHCPGAFLFESSSICRERKQHARNGPPQAVPPSIPAGQRTDSPRLARIPVTSRQAELRRSGTRNVPRLGAATPPAA